MFSKFNIVCVCQTNTCTHTHTHTHLHLRFVLAPRLTVNRSLTDLVSIPVSGIKTEMVSSPVSVASNGQFPFTPSEMTELGVDTSVLDSAFTSHLANLERLGIGADGASKESLQPSGQTTWNFGLFDTAGWPSMQGKMQFSLMHNLILKNMELQKMEVVHLSLPSLVIKLFFFGASTPLSGI